MPYCPSCGKQVTENAKDCTKCGHSLIEHTKDTSRNKNKASLPWKTLNAVNLIIAFGIFGVVYLSAWAMATDMECGSPCIGWKYRGIYFCLVSFIPAILIYIKNRIVWIFAVVILSGVTAFFPIIAAVSHFYNIAAFIYSFVIFITLILIVIDRKNYFKMVRQRELEKKVANKECSHG